MKTRNLIFALVIGSGISISSNVHAIDPISFSTDKAVSKTELIVEKDIKVQDWMVEAEVFYSSDAASREKSLELESWMIEGSWNKKGDANVQEPALKVEDWMLRSFNSNTENTE